MKYIIDGTQYSDDFTVYNFRGTTLRAEATLDPINPFLLQSMENNKEIIVVNEQGKQTPMKYEVMNGTVYINNNPHDIMF